MSDSSSWSFQLGRLRRVPIRVHALFVVVGVLTLFLATSHPGQESAGYGMLAVTILFLSVLAHEGAHAFAASRVGGASEPIVIGPLGGLGSLEVPREPQAELITILAGPLLNLAVLLFTMPLLLAAQVSVPSLANPLAPVDLIQGEWWLVSLKLTFWINWVLVVANLLPAFPLDGARILRTLLWPALDYRGASLVAVRASKLSALGVCLLAWLMPEVRSADVLPSWVPLVLLAVWMYFSACQEATRLEEGDWDEDLLTYDFSQGYTSLERTLEPPRRPGNSLRRWLKNRRELRKRRRQSQELDEERQVDEILLRLHESGMNGLSAKERAVLNRVSVRYRNRQRS